MSKRTLLWHVIFWVVYMSIFTFVEGGYNNQFKEAMLLEVAYFPVRLFIVYLNYFLLMPRLLLKGETKKYIIYTLVSIIIATLVQRCLSYYYVNELIFPDWNQGSFWQSYKFLQAGMILTSPMIFLIGITVVYRLVESQRKIAEIGEERTKAELQYLKNQINPHFFFNTLNNLYGLALAKSDKTADVVMKLSELMSYMLYETQHQSVSVEKEINYIRNYIELEEVRFDERFTCNLDITGNDKKPIPPMLLLPFVENAFKHGVHTSSKGAWIKVRLNVEEEQLTFEVENSVGDKRNDSNGGLGISNVKRRLELLFPEKHDLNIHQAKDTFRISLRIEFEK
jgi:two-component system, LytTR family, sensor kinase